MDAIEITDSGIKCDNPECDYKNENVTFGELHKWINKPCPKCGHNLLTQTDYDNAKGIYEIVETMNKILPKGDKSDKVATMKVSMNGTGKLNLNIGNEK